MAIHPGDEIPLTPTFLTGWRADEPASDGAADLVENGPPAGAGQSPLFASYADQMASDLTNQRITLTNQGDIVTGHPIRLQVQFGLKTGDVVDSGQESSRIKGVDIGSHAFTPEPASLLTMTGDVWRIVSYWRTENPVTSGIDVLASGTVDLKTQRPNGYPSSYTTKFPVLVDAGTGDFDLLNVFNRIEWGISSTGEWPAPPAGF